MKERSMNKFYQTPKLESEPKQLQKITNIYAHIKQKYQSPVPSLIKYASKQKTMPKLGSVNQQQITTAKRSIIYQASQQDKIQQNGLIQSIYLSQKNSINKQSRDGLPPLVKIRSYKQELQQDTQKQNINRQFEIRQKKKDEFYNLAINTQIQSQNKIKKEGWINKKKTSKQILCSVLLNPNRLQLFLKSIQQNSIRSTNSGYEQTKANKIVKNNELLSCILNKVQQSKQNGQASPQILKQSQNIQIKFSSGHNIVKSIDQQTKQQIDILAQRTKQLKSKTEFIQEVRNQYDKIINNYADTVMNIIKDKYGGKIPQISQLSHLTSGMLQRSIKNEDNQQQQDQITPLVIINSPKNFKLSRKDTFGIEYFTQN